MPRFCSRELRNAVPPQVDRQAELQAELHEVLQEVERTAASLARAFHRAAFLVEVILQVAARGVQGQEDVRPDAHDPPEHRSPDAGHAGQGAHP